MQPAIRKHDDSPEFETPERCAIVEVANDGDDPDVSIARARVRPGVTTAWHELDATSERYLIISGAGVVEVGEDIRARVGPGDVVRIPPGVRQRITNDGVDDLVFYAVCSPRYQAHHYRTLE